MYKKIIIKTFVSMILIFTIISGISVVQGADYYTYNDIAKVKKMYVVTYNGKNLISKVIVYQNRSGEKPLYNSGSFVKKYNKQPINVGIYKITIDFALNTDLHTTLVVLPRTPKIVNKKYNKSNLKLTLNLKKYKEAAKHYVILEAINNGYVTYPFSKKTKSNKITTPKLSPGQYYELSIGAITTKDKRELTSKKWKRIKFKISPTNRKIIYL